MLSRLSIGMFVVAIITTSAPAVAQNAPSTRDLERINWMEFKEVVPAKVSTVLLPLGSL
jgi:creatinine amidohydrolase